MPLRKCSGENQESLLEDESIEDLICQSCGVELDQEYVEYEGYYCPQCLDFNQEEGEGGDGDDLSNYEYDYDDDEEREGDSYWYDNEDR